MVVTNQPNPLYDTFIEPFYQGIDNLKAALEGKRVELIYQQAAANRQASTEIDMSLLDRIGAAVIGIILLIPLINAIAFAILRAVESRFVFQRVNGGELEAPAMGELFQQRKNQGICLAPEMAVAQEPPATPEEYLRRKVQALADLPSYPAAGHANFVCDNQVLQYDLDAVLAQFSHDHSPTRLTELYEYAQVEEDKRGGFTNCVSVYDQGAPNPRKEQAKHLLSQLYDFFNRNKALFPAGSQQEGLFKAQIRDTFDRIQDAHNNCVDQVLSQLESIVSEVIADVESRGGQTMIDRLKNRTAFVLFKYRANLIKTICVAEYPDERHMADMERLVKQRLAEMMGIRGEVLNVGAQYGSMIGNADAKIANIASIFWSGEPSAERIQEDDGAVALPPNVTRRRAECKYDPVAYLAKALRTYHGEQRTLRDDLFIWARSHFDFATECAETTNFQKTLSPTEAEPDDMASVENGGELTHPGLLYLLTQTGILQKRPAAAAA